MCWAVHIDGHECRTRNEVEQIIGEHVVYVDGMKRLKCDHCLCVVDVPGTMVKAGYCVRGWFEGDVGEPGDHFARRYDTTERTTHDPRAF